MARRVVSPNKALRDARLARPSPSRPDTRMSRSELATAVNALLHEKDILDVDIDAGYVSKLEAGEYRWPRSPHRRWGLRTALKVKADAEIGLYPDRCSPSDAIVITKQRTEAATPPTSVLASAERAVDIVGRGAAALDRPSAAAPEEIGVAPASGQPPNRKDMLIEPPSLILARIRQQDGAGVSDAMLDVLELYVADVVDRYEEEGPAVLAPDVVRQRQWVEPFLHHWVKPRHHERLVKVAGQLSGQLSYMAINLGRFSSARAYGIEAFELANGIEDDELRAWTRGTQSLAEFYAGRYKTALELAEDGRRYAGSGRQAVRLAVNGQARALGHLGGTEGRRAVDKAVGEAYELLGTFPPAPGMTPCISFGVYSEARVASNAATAYLPLAWGTAKVLEHAARASEIVDASPSLWSKALVRLDMATALIKAERPDIERAAVLAREAMTISSGNRIESIKQRTRSLVAEMAPWSAEPAIAAIIDEADVWLSEEPPADDTL